MFWGSNRGRKKVLREFQSKSPEAVKGKGVIRTARQREVYDLIVHWLEGHGHSPSYGQIAREMGISSRATVHKHINALVRSGLIVRGVAEQGGFILRPRGISETPQTVKPCKRHPAISAELRWEIWERDNFTCQFCGSRRFLSVDHKVPRSLGGNDSRANLHTLCVKCNSKKGRKAFNIAEAA